MKIMKSRVRYYTYLNYVLPRKRNVYSDKIFLSKYSPDDTGSRFSLAKPVGLLLRENIALIALIRRMPHLHKLFKAN